ncbi:glycosyl hydrolase family 25 [Streptomyces sp. Ag109_O5-1]|uniref:glycoside hydrolase family 25 protein n=1 Tax=Streptomyces sp. Ag109_O5-1 TaxID=1938851 RepID=UPI000F4D7CA9|nr:glycoside hydrolase family 25 protein [Streptomyces sp. Ag109_O5-1]RPE39727.1 glycosyl hydrolase family 25 [Streptomyces sp. Ag109_O5-1]
MIHGIDVSGYNAATPDLTGQDFCFIKATEGGSYVNPKQSTQTAAARKAGVVVGFYHFARPGDMQAQAQHFVDKCESTDGDVLAIDWEDSSVSCADKDLLLKAVKKLRPTHRVIVYCNTGFWLHRDSSSFVQDGLWIADYSHPAGHPPISAKWLIHQYADHPTTDQDVAQFASRAAMKAWATGDTTKTDGGSKTPTKTEPTVDLSKLIAAAKTDPKAKQGHQTYAAGVKLVEAALRAEGLLGKEYAGDGSYGTTTLKAYAKWQEKCGVGGPYDGIPGIKSLTALGKKHGFKVVA